MLNALLAGVVAGLFATSVSAEDKGKPAAKHEEQHAPSKPAGDKKGDMASMSRTPAPKTGSMPKGDAPKGKLGTEPTAKGRLGTDPKPGEGSKPPRLN
jgi:hypothetical protein